MEIIEKRSVERQRPSAFMALHCSAPHRTPFNIIIHKSCAIVNNVTDIVYIVLAFVLEILSLRNPPSTNVSLTNEIRKETHTQFSILSLYLNRSRCICCECVCGVVGFLCVGNGNEIVNGATTRIVLELKVFGV